MSVLAELQAGLVLSRSPFGELAEKLDIDLSDLLDLLNNLLEKQVLREISPVFNGAKLGYASTLIAASVPESHISAFVDFVNAMPGVSHNYGRGNDYNVWFTIALPLLDTAADPFEPLLAELKREFALNSIISLPVHKMYKLRVQFGKPLARVGRGNYAPAGSSEKVLGSLGENERALIRQLQKGLPLCEFPFARIAGESNSLAGYTVFTESGIIQLLGQWQGQGIIRRIAGRVRHYNMGYNANAMLVLSMDESEIDSAGKIIAGKDFVSHCYHRQRLSSWPYDMYAMVHAGNQNQLDNYIAEIISQIKPAGHSILYTKCEYKKMAVKYFE